MVMHEKVAWMKNRLTELAGIEVRVNEHLDKQLSLTDPDSKLMKTSNMVRQVCYNVQSAVEITTFFNSLQGLRLMSRG